MTHLKKDKINQSIQELLITQATNVFIDKSNRFNSQFFSSKFLASILKLSHLKNIELKKVFYESKKAHLPKLNLEHFSNFMTFDFSFNEKEVGLIFFSFPFIQLSLHYLQGGREENIDFEKIQSKELSLIERAIFKNLSPIITVSLREGLTGLLGIPNQVGTTLSDFKNQDSIQIYLNSCQNFFQEDFLFKFYDHKLLGQVSICLKSHTFRS